MTEILFYHLERARLLDVLPNLLEKSLDRGWRAYVLCGNESDLEELDDHLWTYRDDSFLPHSIATPENATSTVFGLPSVQLGWGPLPNHDNIDALFATAGADVEITAIERLVRCIKIFNGNDEDEVQKARNFWKIASRHGHDVTYWKQSSEGRWQKAG